MSHYWHRGECGDIIYALAYIKATGGGALTLRATNEHGANNRAALGALVQAQPYIHSLETSSERPAGALDLRECIDSGCHYRPPNIIRPYWESARQPFPEYEPWLEGIEPHDDGEPYSVVNVTHRYRDDAHIWGEFLPDGKMIFLGHHEEFCSFDHHLRHRGYQRVLPRVHWIRTPDLLAAAQIIKGARAFFGNASACLALAQGVGQRNIFVEVGGGTQHTCLFGHERVLNLPEKAAA